MAKRQKMIVAAVTAGVVAAGIVYLMYKRPQWRRQVVEVGRHLLNLADGVIKRREEEALPGPGE
ncbi:MAG: hypothetical protein ACYDCO_01685 [Armatimonadota bacterium]